MFPRLLPALMAGLFVGLAAGQAHAGLFDDEEARLRINEMRSEFNGRVSKLEAGARAQLELADQIELLKTEIARLRGENEVLSNDLANAIKRQKDFYVDLDNRLRKLEPHAAAEAAPQPAASPAAAAAPAAPPVTAADPAAESRDYEAALTQLRGGKYKEAATGFIGFIRRHPGSSFQPSAHFWAASSLYQLKDNAGAAEYYAKVANQWPDDNRAPDALLGLASAQQAQGDAKAATRSLERLVAKYPSSSAAQIARQRLKK
ncbi:MAG: tol-pal system protein YbgF [Zoogloea sp.]|uniref:tol-pal system protein YbgF n=1 Tax=Zoogloea sp. TaxID=49181 RepID=UPI00262714CE|nr:tol-pal system protein YbgF [Zoogloea sp.]MDD3329080.1 tol-pal system protein YbgF [Zoogloea sp.]